MAPDSSAGRSEIAVFPVRSIGGRRISPEMLSRQLLRPRSQTENHVGIRLGLHRFATSQIAMAASTLPTRSEAPAPIAMRHCALAHARIAKKFFGSPAFLFWNA